MEWMSPSDDKEWPRFRLDPFPSGGLACVGSRFVGNVIASNDANENMGDTKGGLSVECANLGEDHLPVFRSSLGTPAVSFFVIRGDWTARAPSWGNE